MPLRQIGDGHASPLDMEFIKRNFVKRLKDAGSDVGALQRNINVKPGPNELTHKMLYQDILPESAKAYSEMNSLDVMRLVSSHDKKLVAGMPAIETGTLYFNVGSVEDKDTLDAGSSAYGMRSGEELTMEATVRYEGAAGTIALTHMDATAVTETIYASNGDNWQGLKYTKPSGPYECSQGFTPGAAWTIQAVQLYLKRDAGVTAAEVIVEIYSALDSGAPDYAPENRKGYGILDVSSISTTGAWITIPLDMPMPRAGAGREFCVVVKPQGITGVGEIHWYIDNSAATYADGKFLRRYDAGWSWAQTADAYLKLDVLTEETTNLVVNAAYAGWQEASADVTLRLAHDFYEKMNFADFYLTVPAGMAVNALCLRDKASGGEVHWRCDHVRTRHIMSPDAQAAAAVEAWTWGEWSSTSWDNDAKGAGDNGIIDLSAVFSLPAGIKAISFRLAMTDSTANQYCEIAQNVGAIGYGVRCRNSVADIYTENAGIVPCDANGDVYFYAGSSLDGVRWLINGYLS